MKAVIANRIYIEYDEALMVKIRERFTHKIPPRVRGGEPEIIQTYNKISNKVVSIPSGAIDFIPKEYEIIDKRVAPEAWWPDHEITLRPSQQEVCDAVDECCMVNAKVSWGKTFTALAIGAKLGMKTLVVVHTGALRDQWIVEAQKIFGETPGVIGNGHCDYSKWLTIGTVQTVSKMVDQIKEEFGLVIVDEMHHISANTFKLILDKLSARYKIGLSGTLIRKDGKHIMFEDYLGKIKFIPPGENSMEPEVIRMFPDVWFDASLDNNANCYALQVSALSRHPEFVKCVTESAVAMASQGHSVLVVSERLELLEKAHELTKDFSVLVTSKTKRFWKERFDEIMTGEKKILWGSLNIFSEGISVNRLSCLVLACQINNEPLLEQLVGRVTRLYPDKLTPIIIDIVLRGNTVRGGIRTRLGHYINKGYKVTDAQKSY